MIFRQLFEPLSSTYTYLLGCDKTGQAVLIDPVIVAIDRDLAEISRLVTGSLPGVPGNKLCGVCPRDLPGNFEKYCRQMTESPQG